MSTVVRKFMSEEGMCSYSHYENRKQPIHGSSEVQNPSSVRTQCLQVLVVESLESPQSRLRLSEDIEPRPKS